MEGAIGCYWSLLPWNSISRSREVAARRTFPPPELPENHRMSPWTPSGSFGPFILTFKLPLGFGKLRVPSHWLWTCGRCTERLVRASKPRLWRVWLVPGLRMGKCMWQSWDTPACPAQETRTDLRLLSSTLVYSARSIKTEKQVSGSRLRPSGRIRTPANAGSWIGRRKELQPLRWTLRSGVTATTSCQP